MDVLEGNLADKTPQSGTTIIDEWLTELHKAENAKDISSTLEQLNAQLKSNQNQSGELVQLLETLATQTAEFSTMMGSEGDIAPRLEGLAAALRSLAGQVSNK